MIEVLERGKVTNPMIGGRTHLEMPEDHGPLSDPPCWDDMVNAMILTGEYDKWKLASAVEEAYVNQNKVDISQARASQKRRHVKGVPGHQYWDERMTMIKRMKAQDDARPNGHVGNAQGFLRYNKIILGQRDSSEHGIPFAPFKMSYHQATKACYNCGKRALRSSLS